MIDNTIDTMFNIKTYIDSLPEDIEVIDVSFKGITSLDVRKFKNLKKLYCYNNKIYNKIYNKLLHNFLIFYFHLNLFYYDIF